MNSTTSISFGSVIRLSLPIGFGVDAFAAKLNVLKPIVSFALCVRYGIPSPGEFAMTVETFDAFNDYLTARHRYSRHPFASCAAASLPSGCD